LNGEVSGRCDGDGISEGACEIIVRGSTRVADIATVNVVEPCFRPNGETDSMQPVSGYDVLIER
jgi:hypothetical protein